MQGICVFFALTIMGGNSQLNGWVAFAVVAISLIALFLTAVIVTRKRMRAARAPVVRLNMQAPPAS